MSADVRAEQKFVGGGAVPTAPSSPTSASGLRNRQHKKQVLKSVLLFYVIACGFAWLAWMPLVLGPAGLKLHKYPISLPVSACIGTLGPLLGCFVTHRMQTGNWRAVRLLPRSRLQMIWLIAGPLLVVLCFFLLFPAFISKGDPRAWHWHVGALVGLWVPMFNYNLFGGPLFEEFGWRGFLQPQLQQVLPPWIAAICVGIMWAAWHLPLFLVGWSSASPLVFTFIVIALSVLMAFAFNASGRAVVVAILMHSAFNSSPGFLPSFLGSVPTREPPSGELLLGCSFLLSAVAVIIVTRGRLFAGAANLSTLNHGSRYPLQQGLN
jgi:membrane protease YdiL (CAAX protease family)